MCIKLYLLTNAKWTYHVIKKNFDTYFDRIVIPEAIILRTIDDNCRNSREATFIVLTAKGTSPFVFCQQFRNAAADLRCR